MLQGGYWRVRGGYRVVQWEVQEVQCVAWSVLLGVERGTGAWMSTVYCRGRIGRCKDG